MDKKLDSMMDLANPYGGFGGGSFFALENVFLSWSYMLYSTLVFVNNTKNCVVVVLFCFVFFTYGSQWIPTLL